MNWIELNWIELNWNLLLPGFKMWLDIPYTYLFFKYHENISQEEKNKNKNKKQKKKGFLFILLSVKRGILQVYGDWY